MMSEAQPRIYYVEDCLPSGTVHLLAGASGAGKTTILFQLAQSWHDGDEFLGHKTFGQSQGKFFYVIGDHGQSEADEHMSRMGVKGKFGYSVVSKEDSTVHDYYECPKDTRILAIDGAEALIEAANINNFDSVRKMLIHAREFAERQNCAVLLIAGSPKMKKGEEYLYGRERVVGSIAWGRYSSTVMNLIINDPSQLNDPQRTLFIYPRHHRPMEHSLTMGDRGFTVPLTPDETITRVLITANVLPGRWLTRQQLSLIASQGGSKEATLDRVLAGMIREGKLIRNDEGKFSGALPIGS